MPAKKSQGKKSSSGSDPKSKRIVRGKMQKTMHEFKHHELQSGRSGKRVKNPKQAIAIGLSEARRSGANIPPRPSGKKSAAKKTGAKKTAAKKGAARTTSKSASRKAPPKKSAAKKKTSKKSTTKKSASKRSR